VKQVNQFLNSIISWLRAGYPDGIPPTDYFPVLALLSRRLSDDEIKIVASEVMPRGEFDSVAVAGELMQRGDFDEVDIGVLIAQLTDRPPSPHDIERVRVRLAAKGWPLDDQRDDRARI
jgi:hypothetical protein